MDRATLRITMRRLGWLLAAFVLALATVARAEGHPASLQLSFVPTDRAQIAVWVERKDGTFLGSFALTHATATAGIANRPGALQMNSGFRWPYGRREGVLPVWAHRRAAAPNAKLFRRVIFQDRGSEGFASRTTNDQSVDDYYCLSFKTETTGRDALDAVTCASVFNSDKGRFITQKDVDHGYAEPFEKENGNGMMRPLGLTSLYPPRRNVDRCGPPCGNDHADVTAFKSHALSVMPELDAISRATPSGQRMVNWVFDVPQGWSTSDDYVLYLEVNVEGDYDDDYNDELYPTPDQPSDRWDYWSRTYGYAYRGQPSIVWAIPFRLDRAGEKTASEPVGYGALHGEDGELRPLDPSIVQGNVSGSGINRLVVQNGVRATLRVNQVDPCSLDDPPAECGKPCMKRENECGELTCDGTSGTCQSYCVATPKPSAVTELDVAEYPNRQRAHMWAKLEFRTPMTERRIGAYEVRVKAEGGDWDQAFTHDAKQELLPVALDVCADPENPMLNRCPALPPGSLIQVDLAGLKQSTRYEVSVTPRDERCHELGAAAYASFETPSRTFTTVSPCFIATAAYGSPLAREIGVLRQLRDRYLAPHALGRALIGVYYSVGPTLAEAVREHTWLRGATRAMLAPLVAVASWWMS